jgi:hypothetical protein
MGAQVVTKKAADPASFLDVVLVTRADMEEKNNDTIDLKNKIGEIQVQSEYKLHLHEQDWNEKTKKMKEEMEAARSASEARFEALRRRKEQQELEAVEAIQNMERAHMKAAEELESLYEKKLSIEAQRYRALLHEKEDMECSYEEQLEITKSKYNSVIMKLKGEFETKTKEQQDAYNRLKDELANTKASYEEFVRQQDEDHEDEMLQVQHSHKKALEEEQDAVANLKSQAGVMRRRFDSFKVEKDALVAKLQAKEDELKVSSERNDEQERQIQMLKNDIRDREQTIDNKEKRISELRMKAKELEKIKFVLDYKYKELKKEMEPKETQIVHMKEQIKEMDHELERDVRTNHALGQALNDKTHKIDNLNLEIKRQRAMVLEKERLVQLFVTDLEKLVTEIDPSYWRDAIRQLYRTYVKKGSKEAGSKDVPDSMDEFARQRDYMERSLETLKKRALKNEEAVKFNNVKKASENALLIDELNSLRREKHHLEIKVQELTCEVQSVKRVRSRTGSRQGDDDSPAPGVRPSLLPRTLPLPRCAASTSAALRIALCVLHAHAALLPSSFALLSLLSSGLCCCVATRLRSAQELCCKCAALALTRECAIGCCRGWLDAVDADCSEAAWEQRACILLLGPHQGPPLIECHHPGRLAPVI